MTRTMRVKNWDEFQHYKHRDPPWIRLYRRLLNDREWHALSGDDAKMLVNLWLLAGEDEGWLPGVDDIAFRLRLAVKQVASALQRLSHWLEQDASVTLAECNHDAIPETETDNTETDNTETDTDSRKRASSPRDELKAVLDDKHADAVIEHRIAKRARLTAHAAALLAKQFAKCPDPNAAADAMIANGWQGFKPEWLERPARAGPKPDPFLERLEREIAEDKAREAQRNAG